MEQGVINIHVDWEKWNSELNDFISFAESYGRFKPCRVSVVAMLTLS